MVIAGLCGEQQHLPCHRHRGKSVHGDLDPETCLWCRIESLQQENAKLKSVQDVLLGKAKFQHPLTPEQLAEGFAEVEQHGVNVSMIAMCPKLLNEVILNGSEAIEMDFNKLSASLWDARLVATSLIDPDEIVFVFEDGRTQRFKMESRTEVDEERLEEAGRLIDEGKDTDGNPVEWVPLSEEMEKWEEEDETVSTPWLVLNQVCRRVTGHDARAIAHALRKEPR